MALVRNFDDIVRLTTITPQQVDAAHATIRAHATNPADLALLTDAIHPTPHDTTADRSRRRALPRRGAEL